MPVIRTHASGSRHPARWDKAPIVKSQARVARRREDADRIDESINHMHEQADADMLDWNAYMREQDEYIAAYETGAL